MKMASSRYTLLESSRIDVAFVAWHMAFMISINHRLSLGEVSNPFGYPEVGREVRLRLVLKI